MLLGGFLVHDEVHHERVDTHLGLHFDPRGRLGDAHDLLFAIDVVSRPRELVLLLLPRLAPRLDAKHRLLDSVQHRRLSLVELHCPQHRSGCCAASEEEVKHHREEFGRLKLGTFVFLHNHLGHTVLLHRNLAQLGCKQRPRTLLHDLRLGSEQQPPDRKLDDALGGDDLGDLLGWLLDVLAREELQHGVSRDVDSDAIHEKCLGVAGAHG